MRRMTALVVVAAMLAGCSTSTDWYAESADVTMRAGIQEEIGDEGNETVPLGVVEVEVSISLLPVKKKKKPKDIKK